MVVARRTKLPLRNFSERGNQNRLGFEIPLTGAGALYESYKALGDKGQIVYINENDQIVHHFVDGSIKVGNNKV
jgi:hypothetical protein